MEELKIIIAKNIVKFRTALGLTQIDLAEALNYSDKSVSKWERGQGIPDVVVLKRMAEIFGTTVDDLLTEHEDSKQIVLPDKKSIAISKRIISLMAVGLVWLVATLVFVTLNLIGVKGIWRVFIYAVPVTFIVLTVFSAMWGKKWSLAVFVSLLVWSVLLSIYITFIGTKAWLFFFIGIPLQVLVILGTILMVIKERRGNRRNISN